MGFELDGILKKVIVDSETVNLDGSSERVDIDNREDEFSIQINYSNGAGSVDIDFFYELSVDGDNFVPVSSEAVTIIDNSGTILFDIEATGASYLRLSYTVRSGSVDITALYSGKRRH